MNIETLEQGMLATMGFEPTPAQRKAVKALSMMMCSTKDAPTLVINGYAGTGKTTLMKSFCDVLHGLNVPVVLLAPTGRAAKVLANYTGRPAMTIHRGIYRQETADAKSGFSLSYNKIHDGVFVVDEASMVGDEASGGGMRWGNGRLLSDLAEYVFMQPGNRLVLVGDPDQLPPVGLEKSPALDVEYLKRMGLTVGRVWLSDVVRQRGGSLILEDAMALRKEIETEESKDGKPTIKGIEGEDVEHISGAGLLEKIEVSFEKFGMRETVIITRSNKRATMYNIGIRGQALYLEERLAKGDMLIVTKNNYLWAEKAETDFIANGDIVEVVSIYGYEEMGGLHFADVSVRLVDRDSIDVDCKVLLDFLTADVAVVDEESHLKTEVSTAQINERLQTLEMEDYGEMGDKRKRAKEVRKDEWINALQVRYAYAITCHKAQGGQWDAVFIDLGYVGEDTTSKQIAQWMYTAMTRARKKVYLVNYEEKEKTGNN